MTTPHVSGTERFSVAASVGRLCLGDISFGQILPPTNALPWNILSEGSQGEYRDHPVGHPLEDFSGSPFLFDYQNDLYGIQPENISIQTQAMLLRVADGRKLIQFEQNINGSDLIMKRLLV